MNFFFLRGVKPFPSRLCDVRSAFVSLPVFNGVRSSRTPLLFPVAHRPFVITPGLSNWTFPCAPSRSLAIVFSIPAFHLFGWDKSSRRAFPFCFLSLLLPRFFFVLGSQRRMKGRKIANFSLILSSAPPPLSSFLYLFVSRKLCLSVPLRTTRARRFFWRVK